MIDISDEKRSENRLLTRLKISAKIISTQDSERSEGDEIECITRDISFTGICLVMQENLPLESKLMLKIEDSHTGMAFDHKGEIAWSREKDGEYLVGLHLYEHLCDVADWKNVVINLLGG